MSSSHACRICGSQELISVLDMGDMPLANRLLSFSQLKEPEPRFPLHLVRCPSCTLLQITETVPPEELFRDYVYCSSYSDTMLTHCRAQAHRLIDALALTPSHQVVEAASNDGYFLRYFAERGIPVLGIEPARNIAAIARSRGIASREDFFSAQLAQRLREEGTTANLFLANNVLAHVPDPNDFVDGIKTLLAPDGLAVIEVPYAMEMFEHCEFDTIYHEHLCYFSLTALNRLFRQNDLALAHVERIPIHGGSLQLWVMHEKDCHPDRTVNGLLRFEERCGIKTAEYYQAFAQRVEILCRQLLARIRSLRQEGRRLAAYGASAKGSTLLNYLKVPEETLSYVVDRSTLKQGRFTPGARLPIYSPDHLLQDKPDYVLLLTWNFAEEILQQQEAFRSAGGRFVIPIPHLRVA
jgi:hypothetical protein